MPCGTSSAWKRHDHAHCPSSNTAIACFARAPEPRTGVNPKTVAKWRKRATVEYMKTGPCRHEWLLCWVCCDGKAVFSLTALLPVARSCDGLYFLSCCTRKRGQCPDTVEKVSERARPGRSADRQIGRSAEQPPAKPLLSKCVLPRGGLQGQYSKISSHFSVCRVFQHNLRSADIGPPGHAAQCREWPVR